MSEYVIVWNESKNEGVIFRKRPEGQTRWDRGSKSDALHASGGRKCNPCSSLADYFRESYGEAQPCTVQTVEIDEAQSISRRSFSARK